MNLTENDILICYKKKKNFFDHFIYFTKDIEPGFTSGKIYEIKKVLMGSIDGSGRPFESLIIREDNGNMRFINDGLGESLSKILFSQKQLRKIKLRKINECNL